MTLGYISPETTLFQLLEEHPETRSVLESHGEWLYELFIPQDDLLYFAGRCGAELNALLGEVCHCIRVAPENEGEEIRLWLAGGTAQRCKTGHNKRDDSHLLFSVKE